MFKIKITIADKLTENFVSLVFAGVRHSSFAVPNKYFHSYLVNFQITEPLLVLFTAFCSDKHVHFYVP